MKTQLRRRDVIVHSILTLAGALGIPAIFLPFAYGYSPWDAILDEGFWRLGLPFFLSPFATAGSLRWIISGAPSRPERVFGYVLSAVAATATLLFYLVSDWPSDGQEWLGWLMPLAILGLGVYFLVRGWGRPPFKEFNSVMTVELAYLANGVLCLVGFFGDWQVGAYCVLVAGSMFTLQIALILAQGPHIALGRLSS